MVLRRVWCFPRGGAGTISTWFVWCQCAGRPPRPSARAEMPQATPLNDSQYSARVRLHAVAASSALVGRRAPAPAARPRTATLQRTALRRDLDRRDRRGRRDLERPLVPLLSE